MDISDPCTLCKYLWLGAHVSDTNAELVEFIIHTGDPYEYEILKPGTQLCKFRMRIGANGWSKFIFWTLQNIVRNLTWLVRLISTVWSTFVISSSFQWHIWFYQPNTLPNCWTHRFTFCLQIRTFFLIGLTDLWLCTVAGLKGSDAPDWFNDFFSTVFPTVLCFKVNLHHINI